MKSQKLKQLKEIHCFNCNNIGKPYSYGIRFAVLLGVIVYFFLIGIRFSIIGIILLFAFTNPYICPKCWERHKL